MRKTELDRLLERVVAEALGVDVSHRPDRKRTRPDADRPQRRQARTAERLPEHA